MKSVNCWFLILLTQATAWCPVSREKLIGCIDERRSAFDLDGDGALDEGEMRTLFSETIPKIYHPFLRRVGGVESTMKHCDVDQDGRISQKDFDESASTCLASCWKRVGAAQILC